MPHETAFPVRVSLQEITLPTARDPLVRRGCLSFAVRVSPDGDSSRAVTTLLPQGRKRIRVERVRRRLRATPATQIFEGLVRPGENLLIEIAPVDEERLGISGRDRRLRVAIDGNLLREGGEGIALRQGEPGLDVGRISWDVLVGIESGEESEVELEERAEHVDHKRLHREWELDKYGPPVDEKVMRRELDRRKVLHRDLSFVREPRRSLFAAAKERATVQIGRETQPLRGVRGPGPGASLGYASKVVRLPAEQDSRRKRRRAADLFLPLDPDYPVDIETVRLFHFDEMRKRWGLVPMSAAHPEHRVVWGRTGLRGRFVAIGLPSNPALRATLCALKALRPALSSARAAGVKGITDRICQLILCAPDLWQTGLTERHQGALDFPELPFDPRLAREAMADLMKDPPREIGERLTPDEALPGPNPQPGGGETAPMPGGGPAGGPIGGPAGLLVGGGNVCEQCFGTPFPEELPEIDLCGLPDPRLPWFPHWPPVVVKPPIIIPGLDRCTRWESLGPTFPSCYIRDLAIDPDDSDVIYAAAQRGGVWRSFNGGSKWAPTTDHLPNLNAYAIAVARKKNPGQTHRTVYFGTQQNDLGSDFDLYASTDRGGTWERRTVVPSTEAWEIATAKDTVDLIYMAGSHSLHKSLDGGRTWLVNNVTVDGAAKNNADGIFDGQVWDVKLDPTDDDTVWIAVQGQGVLKSTDAGANWASKTTGVAALSGNGRIVLDIGQDTSAGAHGTDFIVAKTGATVLYSDDGGASWNTLAGTDADHGGTTYGGWCSAVAVGPDDEDWIIAGAQNMDQTKNATAATATWSPVPTYYWPPWNAPGKVDEFHPDIQTIRFDPNDSSRFFVANDGGISRIDGNGATPRRISDGINANILFGMDISQTGSFWAGASTYHVGIIRKNVGSGVWPYVEVAEGGTYRIDPRDSSLHFCNPWGAGLRRSTSSGAQGTWGSVTVTTPGVRALEFRPSGADVIWLGTNEDELHFSTDDGATFDPVVDAAGSPLQLDGTGAAAAGPTAIAFAPSNANVMYVGTRGGRLWTTTTGAQTAAGWTMLPTATMPHTPVNPTNNTHRLISSIVVHPSDPNRLYIGYARTGTENVFYSDDGGNTWTSASGLGAGLELPRFPVVDLVLDPWNPLRIFAALKWGVYVSADGGDWWRPWDDELPSVGLTEMRFRKWSRTLYVSTGGRGAFYRKL